MKTNNRSVNTRISPDFIAATERYIKILDRNFQRNGSLVSAAYHQKTFSEDERAYFLKAYDKLWRTNKIEAYALLRMVFSYLNVAMLQELHKEGKLITEAQATALF